MLSDLAKKLLHTSGLLALYHRLRNRRVLTVIMFHRVLSKEDPRWASSDPDYTVSARLFAQCLDFFRRHYNVVSAEDVLAAHLRGVALPSRPLLVTFDDGWADTHDCALPMLLQRAMPALLFVVHDVIGTRQPFFQECLIGAWRLGQIQTGDLGAALRGEGVAGLPAADQLASNAEAVLRDLITLLEEAEPARRTRVLDALQGRLDDGLRHWLNHAELSALEHAGVAIGMHGKTHTPLTRVVDLDTELQTARALMAQHLPSKVAPVTLSFPHGRYDAAIARRAHAAGYELVFSSDQVLNPLQPELGWLLGRCGFETDAVTDREGRLRPELLALYLFRKPHRGLVRNV